MAMRRLLSLMLLSLCLFFCLYETSSAKDSIIGTKEHPLFVGQAGPVVIQQSKPISADTLKVLNVNSKRDLWDYFFGWAGCAAGCAAAWAAFETRKTARATLISANASNISANAAMMTAKAQEKQNYLVRLECLGALSKLYQEILDVTNSRIKINLQMMGCPDEELDKKLNFERGELLTKLVRIDKEISQYYDKLILSKDVNLSEGTACL